MIRLLKKLFTGLLAVQLGLFVIGSTGLSEAASAAGRIAGEAGPPAAVQAERSGRAPSAASRQKPRALSQGDCIGILGPASNAADTDFSKAVAWLHKLGYRTKLAPSATAEWGYFAGTDSQRAADINAMFADDSVQAILCLRGGYGAQRVLDRLDYAMIAEHPKLFIGYSDVTALHTALGQRSGLVTIHGPMLTSFKGQFTEYTGSHFSQGLTSRQTMGEVRAADGKKLQTIVAGSSDGILIGGNLSLLSSMEGTAFAPEGQGTILFIEEVREPVYKIDRMLQRLWQSGLLQQVNGIVYGDFYQCGEDADPGDFTLDEVLSYYGRLAGVPVVKGLPAGHAPNNLFLPLGVHARLQADSDGTGHLIVDEAYTR